MLTSKGYKYSVYNPISNMRGVGIDVKAKLRARGIKYIWQLVEYGKTEKQRIELAQQIDIPLTVLKTLVSRADLMRLRSVGDDLAYLLATAGVSSCRDLLRYDPEQLHRRLIGLHIGQKIGYHTPTVAQVKSWISEAQELAVGSPE
jgi:nucleotidyltransferase/DNA polymerase involved in DNA repair